MKLMAAVAKWIPIVMVVFSLVSIYALSQIDTIVHETLYSYGLQFSYDWATPYWTIARIAMAMGWLTVGVGVVLQIYQLRRKAPVGGEFAQQVGTKDDDRWSTFRLGDGSTIKVKLVVKGAKRLNKYSPDGMPVYTVDTEPMVQVVDVPDALKVACK